MNSGNSIQFFDTQFQRQIAANARDLNPFEIAALPHLRGKVLDYGCGMGNLAAAAAQNGCSVLALDGSHAAIEHLRDLASRCSLSIVAEESDLRAYEITETFDAIVCIGLLMFFDCPTAYRKLESLQSHVRPGGVAIVNVLIEGTTYMDMFSAEGHCLFKAEELPDRFSGWEVLSIERQEFPAPANTLKVFITVVARKPNTACAMP
jgi:tellurite methyltransferase